MRQQALDLIDSALHAALDSWIEAQRPGWERLMLWQWHVCQASEARRP